MRDGFPCNPISKAYYYTVLRRFDSCKAEQGWAGCEGELRDQWTLAGVRVKDMGQQHLPSVTFPQLTCFALIFCHDTVKWEAACYKSDSMGLMPNGPGAGPARALFSQPPDLQFLRLGKEGLHCLKDCWKRM